MDKGTIIKIALGVMGLILLVNTLTEKSYESDLFDNTSGTQSIGDASKSTGIKKIPYSTFIKMIRNKNFAKVVIAEHEVYATDGYSIYKSGAPNDLGLVGDLIDSNTEFSYIDEKKEGGFLMGILSSLIPMLIFFFLLSFLMNRGGKLLPNSSAGKISAEHTGVKFDDVAGIDEVKNEVFEIVDFIKEPHKFADSGAKMPRGVLLTGEPGTGKTLMAKAIAGEAGVPFIFASGSEFIEMYAGLGASRVRNLFLEAKKNSPCIIFIDEIDAIGKKRSTGMNGSDSEREQTLNQLLVELDGFSTDTGIFVIAATNRSDVLDSALKRAGRFDREINVPLPDLKGRTEILKIHTKKVNIDENVSLNQIAKGLIGFSGASIENLVNEAAIISTRLKKKKIDEECFNKAFDRILMGVEKNSLTMSDEELMRTARHEIGHTLLGSILPEHDPIHKVTIIPRGGALGVAMFFPDKDNVSYSKTKLLSQIKTIFGGRVAEEIYYGEENISTGASNDIEKATIIAQRMVTEWGFGKDLGIRKYFLESGYFDDGKPSEEIRSKIDEEIDNILRECYQEAKNIIEKNKDLVEELSNNLYDKQELTSKEIKEILDKYNIEY